MKVLILGAGRVGASLARALISNGYDIAIIDQDKSSLSELEERLDIMTVHGHASARPSPDDLRTANTRHHAARPHHQARGARGDRG